MPITPEDHEPVKGEIDLGKTSDELHPDIEEESRTFYPSVSLKGFPFRAIPAEEFEAKVKFKLVGYNSKYDTVDLELHGLEFITEKKTDSKVTSESKSIGDMFDEGIKLVIEKK